MNRSAGSLFVLLNAACGGNTVTSPSAVTPVVAPTPTAVVVVSARSLATNDVSILFPLGKGDLWTASMVGRDSEPIFPRSAFDLIQRQLFRELPNRDAAYAALRVVGMRVDPCFGGKPCYPQIRFVLQALSPDGSRAFDGSIHALYNLSEDAFTRLKARLRALAEVSPENGNVSRLEVSPALVAQGMGGPYAVALRQAATEFVSGTNLAKITFMTRVGNARWDFGGFNLQEFTPTGGFPIAGIDGQILLQTVRENGAPNQGLPPGTAPYNYNVTPTVLRGELNSVLSTASAANATSDTRQRAMDALARVENPMIESPDTVDCSACHLANRVRGHLQTAFGLGSSLSYSANSEVLRLVAGADTDKDNLRAFGYFDAQPAISQRVANETAMVLAALK